MGHYYAVGARALCRTSTVHLFPARFLRNVGTLRVVKLVYLYVGAFSGETAREERDREKERDRETEKERNGRRISRNGKGRSRQAPYTGFSGISRRNCDRYVGTRRREIVAHYDVFAADFSRSELSVLSCPAERAQFRAIPARRAKCQRTRSSSTRFSAFCRELVKRLALLAIHVGTIQHFLSRWRIARSSKQKSPRASYQIVRGKYSCGSRAISKGPEFRGSAAAPLGRRLMLSSFLGQAHNNNNNNTDRTRRSQPKSRAHLFVPSCN